MEWISVGVPALVVLLVVTACMSWRQGRRQAGSDLIAAADQMSASLSTPESHDEFRANLQAVNGLELGRAVIMFAQLEEELEQPEKMFAARTETAMVARTRRDLEEVRKRSAWLSGYPIRPGAVRQPH